jgi:tartrate dehydratase beta subunit/fumarate hydratase class I family protein
LVTLTGPVYAARDAATDAWPPLANGDPLPVDLSGESSTTSARRRPDPDA